MEMFTQSELIHEVTLQPIEAFDLDAAIVFSDILLILDVLGVGVSYHQGVGVETLNGFDDPRLSLGQGQLEEKMDYLFKAIQSLKKELQVPLIGFIAAPWTLACYGWQAKEAATATGLKAAFWKNPESGVKLIRKFQDILMQLALFQIKAGVDVIQIFDSHSHLLSPLEYQAWVFKPVSEMIEALNVQVPVIYFTRSSALFLDQLIRLPHCCLSLDWQSDLNLFRERTSYSLQGAFNPWQILGDPLLWQKSLRQMLLERNADPAYICGLGHGILPSTPQEHVKLFVDQVKSMPTLFSSSDSLHGGVNDSQLFS
jgi:uroporphyrinogen decarboxylase